MSLSELLIVGIFPALLWIGWELRRIADLAEAFVKGSESTQVKGNS